jgi:UDP-N-acetylglucosamine transferase subunit ALG13
MRSLFVTTGTQFPFDRLLQSIEAWANKHPHVKIIAQTCESQIKFNNIEAKEFLSPSEYSQIVSKAALIIGHAGMGTIITAHENHIPLIMMPRRFSLGEHRNDHQLATVAKFKSTEGVYVAEDESELFDLLEKRDQLQKCGKVYPESRSKLIHYLAGEIS